MSVSDPGEKIEWGADSEPRKNERVPSSAYNDGVYKGRVTKQSIMFNSALLSMRVIYWYKTVMHYKGGFCNGNITKQIIKFNSALLNMCFI